MINFVAVLLILFVSAALASDECDDLTLGKIPGIIAQMEKEGHTQVLNSDPSFRGACATSCSMTAFEAFRRLHHYEEIPKEFVVEEAHAVLPLIQQAVGRKDYSVGLDLADTHAVLQYLFRRQNMLGKVQLQFDPEIKQADFFLMPNEVLLLGTRVKPAGTGHMILVYQVSGDRARAIDPVTGLTVNYKITPQANGTFLLVSVDLQSSDLTKQLSVLSGIRISNQATPNLPPSELNATRNAIAMMIERLIQLELVVISPDFLLRSNGKLVDLETNKRYVRNLLNNYEDAKSSLSFRLEKLNGELLALALEARMNLIRVQNLVESDNFKNWLEENRLADVKVPPPPVDWSLTELEARMSPRLKEIRTIHVQKAMFFLTKENLTADDVNFGLLGLVDGYTDMAMMAVGELQPKDAHRILSSYFVLVDKIMNSAAATRGLEQHSLMAENIRVSWQTVVESRKKFAASPN